MATLGGEVDKTPRSGGSTRKAEQMRHRAAAELVGVGRGTRRRFGSPEGIRVRRRPSGGESEGRPTGPSRFSQAHSG
jgi:hypothetical protein